MLAWRKDAGMDEVRRDIAARGLQLRWADLPRGPELQPYFPMVLHAGFSRAGHLIQCENSGLIDPGGILDDFGQASRAPAPRPNENYTGLVQIARLGPTV
jgi:hypothetical protein